MTSYIEKISQTQVAPDLFTEVVAMFADMPEADRSAFEARTFHLHELVKRKGLKRDTAIAINFRLEALAHIENDVLLRCWRIPGKTPDHYYVHDSVVRAAAEEPLIERNNAVTFDRENFCRRVLAIAEAMGQA